ncbi:zinc-binding dehydrogenase [Rhodococcoides kyotonense]|uniref:NADPH:quinone reductase n=1 Tax=Rhodococcoides kyotonense TaxID=398843 RepID=A0A239K3H1_9NOCA|nr:zinc-binding dehydrogenase [Rhodococcus kyotonensis]SNT12249.1 NADPH:quinone reductase [Rhodococcus kyotonensis]
MYATVMTEFGGPEVLTAAEVRNPPVPEGWVAVKLEAAALNWHDVLVRRGQYGSPLPHTPGADGAGIRSDTGEKVLVVPSLWWGGDESAPGPRWEILGDRRPGTYAERVVVPSGSVVPKPAGWDWHGAAALPLVGVTTYRALFTRGRLREGESLLVLGAGGGVATMAVMLGAAVGARVIVTSSSQAKIDQAVGLGAAGGVLYTNDGWPDAARQLANDAAGFDMVLDSVGTWESSVDSAKHGGRVVVLGASRSGTGVLDVRQFYFGQYDLLGTTMGSPADFAELLGFLERYSVPPPPVGRVFPLDGAVDAHEYLESGMGFGKVVLSMS